MGREKEENKKPIDRMMGLGRALSWLTIFGQAFLTCPGFVLIATIALRVSMMQGAQSASS